MAKFILINNTRVGSSTIYAGTVIDDVAESTSRITNAGGKLLPQATNGLQAAADLAQARRKQGAPPEELESIMNAALDAGAFSTNPQRGTLAIAAGTGTVAAGITVTASSRIFTTWKGRPTGSTDNAGQGVTARTVGGPGVGAFTVEALLVTGLIDNDAAGAVDWAIYD